MEGRAKPLGEWYGGSNQSETYHGSGDKWLEIEQINECSAFKIDGRRNLHGDWSPRVGAGLQERSR